MPRRRRGRISRRAPLVALVAAFTAVGVASVGPRSSTPTAVLDTDGALPAPVVPAFTPAPPRPLGSTAHFSHWAPVRRAVLARTAPDRAASTVATLDETTPEETRNAVAILAHRADRSGRPWVHVRLPVLPNGTTGWVPRRALGGYETVRTRLVVDLARLRATLYSDGRAVQRSPVGVGMAGWETPRGEFYVRNRLTRYRSPAYGPVAFGTSARSPHATDWPAGGFVGIHGTDRPDLIPGRVSHGCIRMRNADILGLARRMPVGTPMTIR
jgi:lipoprotein-anchoring transpeptidase ErfK/SrfK